MDIKYADLADTDVRADVVAEVEDLGPGLRRWVVNEFEANDSGIWEGNRDCGDGQGERGFLSESGSGSVFLITMNRTDATDR